MTSSRSAARREPSTQASSSPRIRREQVERDVELRARQAHDEEPDAWSDDERH